ncbi:fibronectin type III domain-containing protein [Aquimarina sp. 2201CG14-23]|uniref:fibronectin type III domain-containing protein n=1 Tax=Aquimarina mycalae TaxID=3040073 RepID=UPI002477E2EE|nr:fibronectin type III domain-containing protein [Aquimarina sp. 2201CG14-23]MDH7447363.1 fibronectin type III domain-containing protein [Aquimarina sp. 2201CG14-23]
MKKSYINLTGEFGFIPKRLKKLHILVFSTMFLLSTGLFAQSEKAKSEIRSKSNITKLSQLKSDLQEKASIQKKEAIQAAQKNGWQVQLTMEDGSFAELQRLANDGSPIYYATSNVSAARSTRANHLNIGGSLGLNLDGQNMTAYVWDGGPTRTTHQEFDGAGGNNRVSINDGVTGLNGNSFHAQHVTGTIVASGVQANAKGMAPQAKARTNDWNNDASEATTAASNGMLLSNHSYGFRASQVPDQYFGAYIDESRTWDEIMFNAPYYLMVVAAGNDGNDNSSNAQPLNGNSSYDKLTGHSTSKNNIVVANAQDANVNANGTLISVSINNSSSEGPTDDFRIKPDITGNGTSVYSTFDNSDTAYNSITGTSMASPNVTGSLLLLQQHYNNLNGSFMRAATLKGIALHTADDAGPSGPDAVYGWGLMNTKAAAEAISANGNEAKIEELTLNSGQTYSITVDSDGTNPLMASISWTDRAGTAVTATNSNTAVLVNDLDIRVTKNSTTYSPYRLTGITTNGTGDNTVDPYERVDVANASGSYTITVTNKGSLVGGSQNFSLVVTGLTGTPVVCNATVPAGVGSSNIGSDTATINWTAVPGASFDVRYRQTGTSGWTTQSAGGTSYVISGLSATTSYEAQVRSICSDGSTSSYSASTTFTTTEIQLNYCASNGNSVADEYIGNVQLGTINNASGAGSGGYTDFTSISTSIAKGSSYTITVTPTWTGTVYSEGYSVWIDYNQNGTFDSGEQVWTQSATQTTPVSGSFTVPSNAASGNTRMRVSMKYNGVPTSCESFQYGEVEDYTVTIGGATADTQAPTAPAGLTASNVAETTLTLSWNAATDNVGVTAYDVYQGNTNLGEVTGTTTNITGLTASTAYQFRVKAKDAAGNESGFSNTANVTTATPPDTQAPTAPTGLTASNVEETTLTLSWNAATDNVGVTAYDVYQGSTNLGEVTSTSTNITGLTADTAYQFSVKAKDAAGNESAFSNTVNVTTTGGSTGGGCTSGISSFPYNQGFENTLGSWTQSTADDINWSVDANGTPSSGTGPSSATQGSYYIYVEASGNGTGYPNKQAILNSPCFDLSGLTEASFSFSYHMYGSTNMGSIAVEASDDNGATWTSLWSETGNKGNSWLNASIDLSAYVGGGVQLRFNRITGSTWQADIAIDNVSLTDSAGGGSTDICEGVSEWSSSQSYQAGDRVTYQGNLYERTTTGWTNLGACGTTTALSTTSDDLLGPPTNVLLVYPNPLRGAILNVQAGNSANQGYQIYNTLGQIVSEGTFSKTINVQQLEAGVYMLKVNAQTARFIIE